MPSADVSGTTFHYEDRGTGRALVLLHGFPLDSRIWQKQLEGLSDRFRVIAPDLRGFGKTRSADPFTVESLADDVYALLRRLNVLPCVVGGLSMGGYVTLALSKKCPTDVSGVILVDTKAAGDTPQQKDGRNTMIELVRAHGSKAIADQMLPKMFAPQTLLTRPDLSQELRTIMEGCSPQTIERALLAMRDREDLTCHLPSLADPTLIIVGEQDAITGPDIAQSMHREIPRSKLVVIANAGHLTPMEQPEQVNAAIKEFVQQASLPG